MNIELRTALDRVAGRIRRARLLSGLAACWLVWAVLVAVLAALGPQPIPLAIELAALAGSSGLVCAVFALRSARDPLNVARRIESSRPELSAGLLTAVEGELRALPSERRGFLQQTVIDRAIEDGRTHDWAEAVIPRQRVAGARFAHAASLCALVAAFGALIVRSSREPAPVASALARISPADVQVVPGDAEIERGGALLVVARFGGETPPEARLVIERGVEGPPTPTVAMTRSLDDPTFAGRVESVDADLSYHVEFGADRTRAYRIHVFETPELTRADAKLVYPSYTALEPKTIEDVRHVTAVEGTELSLLLRLNKEVASAVLVDEHGEEAALVRSDDAGAATAYRAAFKLADSHRYKVRLVDGDGRRNKLSAEIAVNVSRNKPPTVALKLPGRDLRVSPVEELRVQAQVDDDYGVVRQGLNIGLGGQEPFDVVVPTAVGGSTKNSMLEHVIDFEALKAAPDQLATYFLWAEDVGPDGRPRRVEGDMYFAEVRHFEEIFRQGEQSASASREQEQQQQGGGAGQQAEQLAELQKQIINGTWKVVRRETGAKATDALVDDSRTLEESQKSAVEQANSLGAKLQDAESNEHLTKAVEAMNDAARLLGQAAATAAPTSLRPALAAEQAAYQALLKLRAREFEVVRNNSRRQRQSGGQAGASRAQRQLNQLELKNDENRFEEQSRARKEAETQKEREQRETRQVVSRLRELAQRQADLNDRVKELQSALEAAKDEPARKEIERQLKRLREQQQQILRDADELRERMEDEQNRDRMAEARQQVEQGREHVRQASEALEEGRLSQALTEGARAGRKLEEVREELRKQSSNQFADALNDMRRQAKELDESQKKATEQLEAWKDRADHSLRDADDRQALTKGLERRREDLDRLTAQMQQTVEDAEETEPLLARDLFDAARKADEQGISDALKETQKLAEFGVPEEAVRSSQRAGQGIGELRERVDQAARGILGDDAAALRLARNEVKDLADQINREVDQGSAADRPDGQRPDQPAQESHEGRRQGEQGREGEQDREGRQQSRQGQQGRQQGQGGRETPQQGRQGEESRQGRQDQPSREGRRGEEGRQDRQGEEGRQDRQERQPGGRQGGGRSAGDRLMEGMERGAERQGGVERPIRGEGYREWSNRMRDVEELLDDPGLRAEAARIRDRVRGAREEFKRHSKEPDWNRLKTLVADPIRELHARIAEEVRRRESPDSLVPIDRDPVPPRFAEGVRRYYERLGSGR